MVCRSNTLSNIRLDAAAIIFDLPARYFRNKQPGDAEPPVPRDTVPEIVSLIGLSYDVKGNAVYAKICPVMCRDNDPSNVANYFLNPCLFRVSDMNWISINLLMITS